MQPFRASPRRIRQPLRAEAPLAYERLSDPILVRRAKDGDRRALGALCARHQPNVEKLARRVLDDREDARDAAQDAFGWSFDDIAAAERMPVRTAKCCAHRGRARLREQLEVA